MTLQLYYVLRIISNAAARCSAPINQTGCTEFAIDLESEPIPGRRRYLPQGAVEARNSLERQTLSKEEVLVNFCVIAIRLCLVLQRLGINGRTVFTEQSHPETKQVRCWISLKAWEQHHLFQLPVPKLLSRNVLSSFAACTGLGSGAIIGQAH